MRIRIAAIVGNLFGLILISASAWGAPRCFEVTTQGLVLTLTADDETAAEDNFACISSAITARQNSATGLEIITFPAGRYIINGTIELASHLTLRGAGSNATILVQAAHQTRPLIASPASKPISAWSLRDLALIGAETATNEVNPQGPALVEIKNPTSALTDHNLFHSVDAIGLIDNVRMIGCLATCLVLTGRGENRLTNITIERAGWDGLYLDSFDNQIDQLVIGGVGHDGIAVRQGNNRFLGGKIFFTGLRSQAGVGFRVVNREVHGLSVIGLSIQDTRGAALELRGFGHHIVAEIDGVGRIGRGFVSEVSAVPEPTAIIADDCQFCLIDARIRDSKGDRVGLNQAARPLGYVLDLRGENRGRDLWRILAVETSSKPIYRLGAITAASEAVLDGLRINSESIAIP